MTTPKSTVLGGLPELLATAPLEIQGQLSGASNATLLASINTPSGDVTCVYKPRRGERPLWDFPTGTLSRREVATQVIADALEWSLLPVTVWRDDGPYGPGMCQEWIPDQADRPACDVVGVHDTPPGWHLVLEAETYDGTPVALVHEDSEALQQMALFDIVVNNADRKGGHILRRPSGELVGIDHGLTFHEEPKLRTVVWGWAGSAIPEHLAAALAELRRKLADDAPVRSTLSEHLSPGEYRALCKRIDDLLSQGIFPTPDDDYPALPWPPM